MQVCKLEVKVKTFQFSANFSDLSLFLFYFFSLSFKLGTKMKLVDKNLCTSSSLETTVQEFPFNDAIFCTFSTMEVWKNQNLISF